MRGQFIRGDGLILPNNISKAGAAMVLKAAFRNTVPTFYVGLVVGSPSPDMTLGDMLEPTVGTHGYGRIAVTRDGTGWPTDGEVGNTQYISTDWLTWAASGGDFDKAIQRVALFGTNVVDSSNPIYALSVPLPAAYVIGPGTALDDRRFKYQLFL